MEISAFSLRVNGAKRSACISESVQKERTSFAKKKLYKVSVHPKNICSLIHRFDIGPQRRLEIGQIVLRDSFLWKKTEK